MALIEIDHSATELVLTRKCADVAKISYHLRLNGDRVEEHALDRFDRGLRTAIEHTLGGDLPDTAWEQ